MQAIFIPHTLCHGALRSISVGQGVRVEERTSAMPSKRLQYTAPFAHGSGHPTRFAGGRRTVVGALRSRHSAGASPSENTYASRTATHSNPMNAKNTASFMPRVAGIQASSLLHQRANTSIKRTGLRPAAYVQR